LLREHIDTDIPVEAFPEGGRYRPLHDLGRHATVELYRNRIREQVYRYIHFGIPCSRFSQIQNLNGGDRSAENPWGSEKQERDRDANRLARLVFGLVLVAREAGSYYTVENPKSSWLWKLPGFAEFIEKEFVVKFGQCEFGLGFVEEGQ
jgi:hypothetical protein